MRLSSLLLPILTGLAFQACGPGTTAVIESVSSITLGASSTSVPVGSTLQVIVSAKDAQGFKVEGANVTWKSSRPTVASVDKSGLVTGLSLGPAVITAVSGFASAAMTVTVTPGG